MLANPRIWHFGFHAVSELPEALVSGHERAYFDYFFDALAANPEALTDARRDTFAKAYQRPEALEAGFDWYRALEADARRNARHKRISTPILYLRGDADATSIDDYVVGLTEAGAERVSSGTITDSGEFSPLESPNDFIEALKSLKP